MADSSFKAGSSSSCLPSLPQDAASVHSNVTDTLQTCDPWDLTIQGGMKPYTIVISGLGLPTIQNETLGSDINTFTFVNRIKPDSQIMGRFHFTLGFPFLTQISSPCPASVVDA